MSRLSGAFFPARGLIAMVLLPLRDVSVISGTSSGFRDYQ